MLIYFCCLVESEPMKRPVSPIRSPKKTVIYFPSQASANVNRDRAIGQNRGGREEVTITPIIQREERSALGEISQHNNRSNRSTFSDHHVPQYYRQGSGQQENIQPDRVERQTTRGEYYLRRLEEDNHLWSNYPRLPDRSHSSGQDQIVREARPAMIQSSYQEKPEFKHPSPMYRNPRSDEGGRISGWNSQIMGIPEPHMAGGSRSETDPSDNLSAYPAVGCPEEQTFSGPSKKIELPNFINETPARLYNRRMEESTKVSSLI